jgi:hypothetical protein
MGTTAWRRLTSAFGLLALASAGGCGTPLPPTYPVTGKVVLRGGQPVPGGAVHLKSNSDPTLTVTGAIGEDGTFALQTLRGKTLTPGAPEGAYVVTVLPPAAPDQRLAMPPYVMPKPFEVRAGDNHLEITVDPPHP